MFSGLRVFFLILPAHLYVLKAYVGRTCGEPGGTELTPTWVELNGSRRLLVECFLAEGDVGEAWKGGGNKPVNGGRIDFVRLPARVPHAGPQHAW